MQPDSRRQAVGSNLLGRFTMPAVLLLLLAACGSSAQSDDTGQPGRPDDGGNQTVCRETVTGDLTVPTVLTNGPEACDYWFPSDGSDNTGYSITSDVQIEAGTVLRFGKDTQLYVENGGSLTATGNEEQRIVFEGAQPVHGYWYGICFVDNRESRLEYVDVRWGGKVWAHLGSNCRGGIAGRYPGSTEPVHIVNSTVSGSYANGLSVHDLQLGEFANNAFYDNQAYGVTIEAEQVWKLDADTDYLGADRGAPNAEPFVYTHGHFSDPGVEHIWEALNAPYFNSDEKLHDYGKDIVVHDGTSLVFKPGVTVVFEGDAELYIYGGGGLGMAGTEDNPVVLTGLHASPGSWNGVRISDAAAILENVIIEWAGRDDVYPGSLVFIEVSEDLNGKIVDNVFIDGSKNCAVRVWHDDLSLFQTFNVHYGTNNEIDYCGP